MSGPELHRGKLARHPNILSVRALTREDLGRLQEKRVAPRIKKLRRAHHIVARLISMGHNDDAIAKITGYSAGRVGQLRADPSMQELTAKLDAERLERIDVEKIDPFFEEAAAASLRGIALVHDFFDEIEESEEPISKQIKAILPIVSEMADRSGHGKHTSTTNVSMNFAEMMKQKARERGHSTVIDAKAVPALASAPEVKLVPQQLPPPEQPQPVVSFRRRA